MGEEIKITNLESYVDVGIVQPERTTIDFVIEGKTIVSLDEDGIHYKGRLLEIDEEIEDAFRDFFTQRGIIKK